MRVNTFSRALSLSAALLVPGIATADGDWTDYAKVTELNQQQLGGSGSEQIFVTAQFQNNPTTCPVKNVFYFSETDARTKRMFAMIMTAQASGKDVRFFVVNEACHAWGMPRLDGVIMK